MEFLKFARKRSFLSEVVYTALNVGLAIAVLLVVLYTQSIWFAIAVVILSKWRVFAVRPRFWWANLQSNLVDFIVSVSVVVHMDVINAAQIEEGPKFMLLLGLVAAYIVWLLLIKPRSKRSYMAVQAGTATFLGMSALFTVSFNWPASLVVLISWLIAYSSARHILSTYDDETYNFFLSLAWGVVVAEISWVAYHWAIAYPLPIFPSLMLPQVALIVTLVSFLAFKCYDSFYKHAKIRMTDVLLPMLFTLSVLVVLLVLFNRVGTAI